MVLLLICLFLSHRQLLASAPPFMMLAYVVFVFYYWRNQEAGVGVAVARTALTDLAVAGPIVWKQGYHYSWLAPADAWLPPLVYGVAGLLVVGLRCRVRMRVPEVLPVRGVWARRLTAGGAVAGLGLAGLPAGWIYSGTWLGCAIGLVLSLPYWYCLWRDLVGDWSARSGPPDRIGAK